MLMFRLQSPIDANLMVMWIVSTIMFTFYRAALADHWPNVQPQPLVHHFGTGRDRFAVMTIPEPDPQFPPQLWNSRVIVEGLVGIMYYMIKEGFRLGDMWMTREIRGEVARSSLGGFRFFRDPEA